MKGLRAILALLPGLAGMVLLGTGSARATEEPAFSPIQTDREAHFVSQELGLGGRIKEVRATTGHVPRIDYAMVDLDADGEGEVFIRLIQGDECRKGTCTTYIFSRTVQEWSRVLETTEAEVTVAKQTHKGYRDIIVSSQPWIWTGKTYRMGR